MELKGGLKVDKVTIKKFFEDDHNRLDNIFVEYQKLKRSDLQKAKESFKEFKIGLQRHIVWEEEILFPLFEKKTAIFQSGPTQVMRIEHKQIKEQLEKIHDKTQNKDIKSDADEEVLLSILIKHNLKEENILYPSIDNVTTDEERVEIFNQMNKLPEESYKKCCSPS